jgi:hypothetical protein
MSFQSCYLKLFMYVIIVFFHRVYWLRGEKHLLSGEGVGGPNSDDGTDTVVL